MSAWVRLVRREWRFWLRWWFPSVLLVACTECAPASRAILPPPEMARDTAFLLLGYERFDPTLVHEAVVAMVGSCVVAVAFEAGPPPPGLRPLPTLYWGVADSIIGLPSGQMAYGISGPGNDGAHVILEEKKVWSNGVTSHEIAHVLGAREYDNIMERCTMQSEDLPLRIVPRDELLTLVDRGFVIPIRRRH